MKNERTRAVNIRSEPYDIYVGRGSKWGNPYIIGFDGNREDVVAQYDHYFQEMLNEGRFTLDELREFKGKRLGCFCKPKKCHADIIARYVEDLCRE